MVKSAETSECFKSAIVSVKPTFPFIVVVTYSSLPFKILLVYKLKY